MNETLNEVVLSSETEDSSDETKANMTQVVGEVVIIAGVLWIGHRMYRAAVRRAARRYLKNRK